MNTLVRKTLALAAIATSLSFADLAAASDDSQIVTGRYSRVTNAPAVEQAHPLQVVVATRIPSDVTTVGGAVEFLLARSGYRLADQLVLSPDAKRLLAYPLPETHRKIGPMTLDQALMMLGGEGYRLVVDPISRKIAYVIDTSFLREEAGNV